MAKRKLKSAPITLAKTDTIVWDHRAAGVSPHDFMETNNPYNESERIIVSINVRDPVVWMYSRQMIDGPQRDAAELLRKYTQESQFGFGAIDTTKEAVDGGKIYEPISDVQVRAQKLLAKAKHELAELSIRLQRPMGSIVHLLVLERMFPRKIAEYFGHTGEGNTTRYSELCKAGLNAVAIAFTVRS